MIYVGVKAIKPSGAEVGGNGWHDTEDVEAAIKHELARFTLAYRKYEAGAPRQLSITVATEASTNRTRDGKPLPERRP